MALDSQYPSFFPSLAIVTVGESPNEIYEAIKQAFNLLVYAQEQALLLASCFSGLHDSAGYMGLIRSERKFMSNV